MQILCSVQKLNPLCLVRKTQEIEIDCIIRQWGKVSLCFLIAVYEIRQISLKSSLNS